MRITNRMMSRKMLENLNLNYKKMMQYHEQISSGKSFQKASENPFASVRSIDVGNQIKKSEQYESNIKDLKGSVSELETSVRGVSDSLTEIRTLVIQGANGALDSESKKAIADSVASFKENIVSLFNKQYGGKYLFGGYNTTTAPLELLDDGSVKYNKIDIETMTAAEFTSKANEKINVKINDGIVMDSALTAIEIVGYGSDNVFSVLDGIIDSLENNDIESLIADSEKLEVSLEKVRETVTMLGGKTVRLETMENQLVDTLYNYNELQANLTGVNIEEAIMMFKTSEMIYNAALSVGAKTIQQTLVDFLR